MSISDLNGMDCAVARTVSLIGDAWTLMIVRELFLGSRRFDELRAYTGISPHLLSVRLRHLAQADIVERRPYQSRPVRYEYLLTDKGQDLWTLIHALREWGDRWHAWPDGPPVTLRHRECQGNACLALSCSRCGTTLTPRDIDMSMSTTARAERRARAIGST